jgi:shikimate kinase / 3-dehydroquinate synthase
VEIVERIVLVGFSGTGKTTVSKILAKDLGWDNFDLDEAITHHWGLPIPEIFSRYGEAAFRDCERSILLRALSKRQVVIATGGGAVTDDALWAADLIGSPETLVVALDAEPETVLDRLRREAAVVGSAAGRPMLASDDPLPRIRQLKALRQPVYDRADITLSSERIPQAQVAAEISALVALVRRTPLALHLEAGSGSSTIVVGPGASDEVGERVRQSWPDANRVWIVTDQNVGGLHLRAIQSALARAGIAYDSYTVEPGEGSKSLETAGRLYDWVMAGGIERGDVIVALGGGVVGDLAGFVAATVLRGVGLMQVPTSLLAAVDSSVGGKTGINHAAGKNLIGVFMQPPLVLVDTCLLCTLPPREVRSGWAEVVKHAVIQRSTPSGERNDLRTFIARNQANLRQLAGPAMTYLVWRNIALKAAVVMADEREAGVRSYLNLGHTLGHAIEASDYRLRHGEAVALGMRAAAYLGVARGTCGKADEAETNRLLDQVGLPKSAELDESLVLSRLKSDKKRIGRQQRFVLPLAGGGVTIDNGVSGDLISEALSTVSVAPFG